MAINLAAIRNELYPGLAAVFARTKEIYAADIFNRFELTPAAPHVWIPKLPELSLPAAVAVGAAVAIVKNPLVTRRFWQGWFNEGGRDAS